MELTNIQAFYSALTVILLISFIWKNRDAHWLNERNDILSVKDKKKTIPTGAKSHHTWVHNYGFGIMAIAVISIALFTLGVTWQAACLVLAGGSLFMILDIVLNIKMESPGWHTWHLGDEFFDRYCNWYVRFGLFIVAVIAFHLIEKFEI